MIQGNHSSEASIETQLGENDKLNDKITDFINSDWELFRLEMKRYTGIYIN